MDDIRDRFRANGAPSTGGRRDFVGPLRPERPLQPQRTPQPAPTPKPQSNAPSSWMQQPSQSQPAMSPRPRPRPIAAQPNQFGPIPQRSAAAPAAAKARKARKKSRKKPIIAVLALLVLLAGGGGAYAFLGRTPTEQASQTPVADTAGASTAAADSEPQLQQGTIRLMATGTFAAYDSIHQMARKGDKYDYLPLMQNIKPALDTADISVCHQETLAGGADKGVSGYPEFNAPFEWSAAMAGIGCSVMNVASLNTNDKGQAAIDAALKYFESQQSIVAVSGANRSQDEQDKIRYFEVKGLQFAYLSYTTQSLKAPANKYSVNVYSEPLAKKHITEAQKNADFVIVGMTWGEPDKAEVTAQQNQIAAFLAKQDVDLVIGNGPHILQPAKVLDGTEGHQTLVWFSLGNAVNSQLPMENLIGGIAVVDIDIQTQDMLNPGLLPVYQHYEWTAAEKANSKFDARKNFSLYMLDKAAEVLAKSQNGTTVEAQNKRVNDIITRDAPINVLSSKDLE